MKTFLAAALFALAAAPAFAEPIKVGDLTIEDAWARATPKGAPVGAAYLTIRNDGAAADRLTSIAVDFAKAQVHEMKMANGVMEMREAAGGLPIPPHATVKLEPGGYHVMLMGLKRPLAQGEKFEATLSFERAGQVKVAVPVRAIGAGGHDMHKM